MANKIEAEIVARLDASSFSRGLQNIKDRSVSAMRELPRRIPAGSAIEKALGSARQAQAEADRIPGMSGVQIEAAGREEVLTNTEGVYRGALEDVEQMRRDAISNRNQQLHETAAMAGVQVDPHNMSARHILDRIHAGFQHADSFNQRRIADEIGAFDNQMFRSPEYMKRMSDAVMSVTPEQQEAFNQRVLGNLVKTGILQGVQKEIENAIGQTADQPGMIGDYTQGSSVIPIEEFERRDAERQEQKNILRELKNIHQELLAIRDDAG